MPEIDRVVLKSVMDMDGEGPGFGATLIAPEVIAAVSPVQTPMDEVRVSDLAHKPCAQVTELIVAEGGPANGQL